MKYIPLGNRYEYEWSGERKDADTGAVEVDASHSGLSATISASDGGSAINAALTVSLSERTGTPGTYYGQVAGSAITSHLTAYLGSIVYEVLTDSAGDVKRSQPLRVVSVARPD